MRLLVTTSLKPWPSRECADILFRILHRDPMREINCARHGIGNIRVAVEPGNFLDDIDLLHKIRAKRRRHTNKVSTEELRTLTPIEFSIFLSSAEWICVPSILLTRDRRSLMVWSFDFPWIYIDGTVVNPSSRKFCQQHRRPVCSEERSVRVRPLSNR